MEEGARRCFRKANSVAYWIACFEVDVEVAAEFLENFSAEQVEDDLNMSLPTDSHLEGNHLLNWPAGYILELKYHLRSIVAL